MAFSKGKIDISFNEKLNKNFIKVLSEKLFLWTGDRWIISLSKENGAKTIFEQGLEKKSDKLVKAKCSETAKKIFSAFPDSELIEISEDTDV